MVPENPFDEPMSLIPVALRGPKPRDLDDMEAILLRWPEMLKYDSESGRLIWRQMLGNPDLKEPPWADKRVGPQGRARVVDIDGFRVGATKLVWLLHHGAWPSGKLRAKDGDKTNTRIENLADASEKPSRPTGVGKFGDGWQAYAIENGKQKNLGRFARIEEAIAARQAWDDGTWTPRPRGRPPGIKAQKPSAWITGQPGALKAWGRGPHCKLFLGAFTDNAAALAACEAFERGEDLV